MSVRYRPRTHADRDLVLAALDHYLELPTAHAALVEFVPKTLGSSPRAYRDARQTYTCTLSAAKDARAIAVRAGEDFDRDFRLFTGSVRDPMGLTQPRLVAELLGGVLPSALLQRSLDERAWRTRGLLIQLPIRSDLRSDPACVETLHTSTLALSAAVVADGAAAGAALNAVRALKECTAAFDRGYSRFLQVAQVVVMNWETAMGLPRFHTVAAKRSLKARLMESPDPVPPPPSAPLP